MSVILEPQEVKTLKSLDREQSARGWCYFKKVLVKEDPFLLIKDDGLLREKEACLKIRTKEGQIRPFILNKAQRHLFRIFKKLWDASKPIRLIVLKARQIGSTTFFMSIFYALISQTESQSATVIADEKDKANEIFEMSKLFQERCPVYLRPEIKKSNERKLEFEGIHSQIAIDTANNPDAGRSATLRLVLLSEYGYYPKSKADALMLGISHSVPTLPETIIVKESTANGFNHFKDEWDAAVAGENDYTPIFVPWYWDEGYRLPIDETFVVGDPAEGDIAADEPELYRELEAEGITHIEERLNWRRWDIKNNCKGDVELFKQEAPSSPTEAFLASGACYFDQKALVQQLDKANPPLFRANIVQENYKWVIRKAYDGDFMFWEEPNAYASYAIGGDACSGSGLDFAALVARNTETNNIAAVYHAKCDPDELAYRAMTLGNLLNKAKVAIENDKFGFAANKKLVSIYGNIYVTRTYNKTQNKVTEIIGWNTSAVTRPMMLSQLQEEIRNRTINLNYAGTVDRPGLIRECLSFIKNPNSGRAEAEESRHDDLVIACAISGQLRVDDPHRTVTERERIHKRVLRLTNVEEKNAGLGFGKRR